MNNETKDSREGACIRLNLQYHPLFTWTNLGSSPQCGTSHVSAQYVMWHCSLQVNPGLEAQTWSSAIGLSFYLFFSSVMEAMFFFPSCRCWKFITSSYYNYTKTHNRNTWTIYFFSTSEVIKTYFPFGTTNLSLLSHSSRTPTHPYSPIFPDTCHGN